MENERPKRNRYEDNPYYLHTDNRNNKYFVNFDVEKKNMILKYQKNYLKTLIILKKMRQKEFNTIKDI